MSLAVIGALMLNSWSQKEDTRTEVGEVKDQEKKARKAMPVRGSPNRKVQKFNPDADTGVTAEDVELIEFMERKAWDYEQEPPPELTEYARRRAEKALEEVREWKKIHADILADLNRDIAECEARVGGRCPFQRWDETPELVDEYHNRHLNMLDQGGVMAEIANERIRVMDEGDQKILEEAERTGIPAENHLYKYREIRLKMIRANNAREKRLLKELGVPSD